MRVVDGAEAVQAEQQHRDAAAQRARERLLEALLEEQPVRQAGQRVVQGLVGDALLQPARLGDVGDRDHHAGSGRRAAAQRLVVGRDRDHVAVRAGEEHRDVAGGSPPSSTRRPGAARDRPGQRRAVLVARGERLATTRGRPAAARAVDAEDRAGRRVGVGDAARCGRSVSRPGLERRDHRPQPLLVRAQLGDVVGVDHHAVGRDEDVADVQQAHLAGAWRACAPSHAGRCGARASALLEVAPRCPGGRDRRRAGGLPISGSQPPVGLLERGPVGALEHELVAVVRHV